MLPIKLLNPLYVYKRRALIVSTLLGPVARLFRARGIALTENDRKIAAFRNKHRGKRCFIIGNGPSLKIEDLDRLKGEITFACNKIYLAFDQTDWRPTYYSVLDVLVAENNREAIDELNLCKVFHEIVRPYVRRSDQITWLRGLPEPSVGESRIGQFSTNVLEGVYGGWTVVYPQIQLAFFMGIREIYLIGVDFSFKTPQATGKTCASGEILEHQGEANHFHPEYRKPGETWTVPKLDLQYRAFLAAKKSLERNGGCIFNASRKTELDIFPRIDFDKIMTS